MIVFTRLQVPGALFIRHDIKCSPFILGGIDQGGHRAGNYSLAGLAALGQAAREALDARAFLCTETARLRTKFETEIESLIPDAWVCFKDQERVPNCTAIAFPGVTNEALLYHLNRKKIYASIGGGTFQQIGLVLAACGIEESLAHSAIHFSLSRETTEEEIERAASLIAECVKTLRKSSQRWIKTP